MKKVAVIITVILILFSQKVWGEEGGWNPDEIEIPLTLGVTLRDAEDGDGEISGEGKKYVMVSVAGVNLKAGFEHLIEVTLEDAEKGEVIYYKDSPVEASRKIIPKDEIEVTEFRLAFDGEEQRGATLGARVKVIIREEEVATCLSTKFEGGVVKVMGEKKEHEGGLQEPDEDYEENEVHEEDENKWSNNNEEENSQTEVKTKGNRLRTTLGGILVIGFTAIVLIGRKIKGQ